MERKGRKKSQKQNGQGEGEMSAGMRGRGWEIKASNKQDLSVNLGKWLNINVGKLRQKIPENEKVKKKKKRLNYF